MFIKENFKTLAIGGLCIALIVAFLILRRAGSDESESATLAESASPIAMSYKTDAKVISTEIKSEKSSSIEQPNSTLDEKRDSVALLKNASAIKNVASNLDKSDSDKIDNANKSETCPNCADSNSLGEMEIKKKAEDVNHLKAKVEESKQANDSFSAKAGLPSEKINNQKNPIKSDKIADVRLNNPKLSDPKSFTFVLYPDPQQYQAKSVNNGIFDIMTSWTASMAKPLNIKAVLCTGDMVFESEANYLKKSRGSDMIAREQWKAVSRAFERLDNVVPYILCTGNHDHGYAYCENRSTHFPEYFYPERNLKNKEIVAYIFPDDLGRSSLENAAYEISDCGAWGNILVVSLEFEPRDKTLAWASKFISDKKYTNWKVVILTHSYMDRHGNIMEKERANFALVSDKKFKANSGKAIFEKLVAPSKNISMVICGHMGHESEVFEESVSRRTDKRADGKNVFQMFFNAQMLGGGYAGNGGDGWLRILEFMPDGKTLKVYTYSPFFGVSPTTRKYAWRTAPYDEFSVQLE